MAGSGGLAEWSEGAAVWFQPPGTPAPLPGELLEVHRAARVLLVGALVGGQVRPNSPSRRGVLGENKLRNHISPASAWCDLFVTAILKEQKKHITL